MKSVTLRLWDSSSQSTQYMDIITKISDLGSPLSYKSINGFYIDVHEADTHSFFNPTLHSIRVFYREEETQGWNSMFTKTNIIYSPGNRKYKKIFNTPIKDIHNIQLRIKVNSMGKLSINDFGLIYRQYREIPIKDEE